MLDLIDSIGKGLAPAGHPESGTAMKNLRGISVAALKGALKCSISRFPGVLAAHITHAHCRKTHGKRR